MVASMAPADGARVFMTAVDADGCTLLLMPMPDAKVPAGKVPELWLLASNGAPHSLGVSDNVHTGIRYSGSVTRRVEAGHQVGGAD